MPSPWLGHSHSSPELWLTVQPKGLIPCFATNLSPSDTSSCPSQVDVGSAGAPHSEKP